MTDRRFAETGPPPARWPAPAREAAADDLRRHIQTSAAAAGSAMPGDPGLIASIRAIGGNSPYLADLARREWRTVLRLAAEGPDRVVADAIGIAGTADWSGSRAALRATLRRAKRIAALAIAWADIGGLWDLERVTAALTRLADAALRAAVDHLLHHEAARGRIARLRDPRAPSRGSGFAVIGMGKLGAGELNYSSDVDLVLLYDPEAAGEGIDRSELASTFARVARDLVTLMEARDADGYVFRVDLRLRPDPGVTPPAISLAGAITYYESMAQTWERAAFSKARHVAGDETTGTVFLAAIAPFVWRRHLDFPAIDDMQAMKARIDEAAARPPAPDPADEIASLLGRDLKRGPGGIREIEFIAQTLQLVWGGRHPEHRLLGTVAALRLLAERNRLDRDDAEHLVDSYRTLRRVEHRLQMVADRQTHALPADREQFARFACFMGVPTATALARHLLDATAPVQSAFRAILSDTAPPAPLPLGPFRHARDAAALIAAFRAGRPRALRGVRARALHERVLPVLLAALGRAADPDAALARWATLIERLPEAVGLLSLLVRNEALIRRIADLLSAAPPLADTLAVSPGAIEGLLAPDAIDSMPGRTLRRLVAGRRDPASLETAIETARLHVRAEEFRLGVLELEDRIDVDQAGLARTALADAVIALLLDRVRRAHERRWGRLAAGGLVVVALGKAGSRRMMAGSDLDLLLVYDAGLVHDAGPARDPGADTVAGATGTGPAPASYYGRLAHALIAALTAPGRDGPLYRCDMRLRPSGRAGPVAVSLASFERYHRDDAWTWERMALTRARPVAGPRASRRRVALALRAALDRATPPGTVATDAVAMRARLLRDRKPEGRLDVKLRPGGLMEVEFIAQALQLGPHPTLRRATETGRALAAAAAAGLLSRADARGLAAADRFWRVLQSRLRLLHGLGVPGPDLAPAVRDGIADDWSIEATASFVGARFTGLLGGIHD